MVINVRPTFKKTYLYNFDPLKAHFYMYIIFLISAQKQKGGYNEFPQSMFWAEIWKKYRNFYLKAFRFWWWNFQYISVNRRVFVMKDSNQQSDQSLLSAWRNFFALAIQNAPSEDYVQTACKHNLIWIFSWRTCPKVRFLTSRLQYV